MENANTQAQVVTDIRPTRKPGIYTVSMNGETVWQCPDEVIVRWHLKKGHHLSAAEYATITAEAETILARRSALHMVAQRPLAAKELESSLRRAGFGIEATEAAVARMRELGYIDDSAYAQGLAQALEKQAKLGTRRIREELVRRGVDRSVAEETLASVDYEAERQKALVLARKRWRTVEPDEKPAAVKRLSAYLQRRGFDWPTIRWCLEQVVPEVDINTD